MRGPSCCIYKPFVDQTMPFLAVLTFQLHTKYKVFGTLSALKHKCHGMRRDIHYCWSISYPSFNI